MGDERFAEIILNELQARGDREKLMQTVRQVFALHTTCAAISMKRAPDSLGAMPGSISKRAPELTLRRPQKTRRFQVLHAAFNGVCNLGQRGAALHDS